MNTIRVLIVDDQPLVREGLAILLERVDGIEVVGRVADGREALALLDVLRPEVLLMDLRMPGMDGIETTRRAVAAHPGIVVLALTTYPDDRSLFAALRAGARGYLTKDATLDEITGALRAVASGATALAAGAQSRLVATALRPTQRPGRDRSDGLTPRETQVLQLVAEGLRNEDIATRLAISTVTVKSHINHIFAKIGAADRAQAVSYAFRSGLV
ncbi:MAG: response regulator transcription factor [Geodermatophilaceae bacterium]|nr:response regulator transcription factor [Geodermatophilaceae bacterium]